MKHLLSRIEKMMPGFSKGQRRIAQYIEDHYDKAAFMTASKLGATVVYPERDMALRIAKRILRKNLVDFLPIGKDIEIIEIEVSDRMVGKTIVDMDLRRRYSLNVIAIHHEEQIETDVRPDCRLCHGDTITVIGKEENVTRFADDYS